MYCKKCDKPCIPQKDYCYEHRWICTDPDNEQYGRHIEDNKFEFKERGIQFEVDLERFTTKEKKHFISAYYKDLQSLKKLCNNDKEYNWIIAECIFEQTNGYY